MFAYGSRQRLKSYSVTVANKRSAQCVMLRAGAREFCLFLVEDIKYKTVPWYSLSNVMLLGKAS